MISEGMTSSIDPPSDRLNSAKPERHLRSTDGMICILPYRDTGPSPYILYEIRLALRARRPLAVFVEDTLPSNVLPDSVLARRFSRRSLLRQIRDQRYALQIFKDYVGKAPPPTYEPRNAQRTCLIIGASRLSITIRSELESHLRDLMYFPTIIGAGEDCLGDEHTQDARLRQASFVVAVVEGLTPREYYWLGAARSVLTPTITITDNFCYPYDASGLTPKNWT
jgi:hypothetical protein